VRRAPIRRKRATGRRVAATCSRQRCKSRPIPALGLCATHARHLADSLAARIVKARDRVCQRCGSPANPEWSHHITRARLSVRYDLDGNSVQHCKGCHVFLTHHPALHVEWVRDYLGEPSYELLLDRAYGPRDANGRRWSSDLDRIDYASTIAMLRDRARALGIEEAA
jgi:hypothetical protein